MRFFEPQVSPPKKEDILIFDKIAQRLGIEAYALSGVNHQQLESYQGRVEHLSRVNIYASKVHSLRKQLAQERKRYELLSVSTNRSQIAQWVVKDNRVDILSIPFQSMRNIVTPPLANVAAEFGTFFEFDVSSLLQKSINLSFYLRTLSRIISVILQKQAPFIFTMNVQNPLDFRDRRAVFSLANILGIPRKNYNDSIKQFVDRVKLNQRKLSSDFIAPGIWHSSKNSGKETIKEEAKIEQIKEKTSNDFENLENVFSFEKSPLNKRRIERQRYLLFEILTTQTDQIIQKKELENKIWEVFTKLFGEVGASRAGLYMVDYNSEKKLGILRCSQYSLEPTRAVLTIISTLQGRQVLIHIFRVSGTLTNLKKILVKKDKN
ncbi:MAG: hypothetical protein GF308_09865 [Candidatus Heimdallarchaeota archaeon]|nr:hypothetical protein [Candidatus Heimdallarchaeota archaeon]